MKWSVLGLLGVSCVERNIRMRRQFDTLKEPIEFDREEIESLLKEISQQILEFQTVNLVSRKEQLDVIAEKLKRVQHAYSDFKLALRDIPSSQAAQYEKLQNKFQGDIKRYESQYQILKQQTAHGDLIDDGTGKVKTVDSLTSSELVQQTHKEYDAAIDRTRAARRVAEEAIELGASVIVNVQEQNDQLSGVDRRLDEMRVALKKGDQLLRAFIRRQATDKLILFWLFLIVVCLFVIIVYQSAT